MGQIKDTTKDRKGKRLIYEERIKIGALFNLGLTPKCIGKQVGNRSRRTIEWELKLGMYERESSYKAKMAYSADIAQGER
jgi:IS30 family transposase